jgi:hypothetical protein
MNISFRHLFTGLSLLISLQINYLNAQNNIGPYKEGLNMKFDAGENKKFDHAITAMDQADAALAEANQIYDQLSTVEKKERISDNYQKALKKLFEASNLYKEAHAAIYGVYKTKADKFWEKMSKVSHRASGMEKARYYEGKATKGYNRSLIRRDQVTENDRYEFAMVIMNDAFKLEKLAIRDEGRAVQICLDYPVEYNYGWDDDKTLEEIVTLMRDPAVNEPPADIFATIDKDAKVDSSLLREVIYKVQIAAHTMPLSNDYLKSIYNGDLKIDMIFEDEWYKYSIGRYLSFDEAEATCRECNIKKAFVVAYESGKHISIQDALKILEEKKQNQ